VAERGETGAQLRRGGRFEVDRQSRVDLPSRRVQRGLGVHPVSDHPHQRLHVARRLDRAAHHAERRERRAAGGEEAGDDGVERPLAAADLVRVAGLERKAGAAVLQADAGARHHDARAEAHVVGLDQRDHHAARVGGGKVDGAALRRLAGAEVLRAHRVDQAGARAEVHGVEQRLGGDVHRPGIGDVAVRVGEGELHRLDLQVLAGGRVGLERGEVEVSEDAQRHLRGDALAVRRHLVDAHAVPVEAQRRDPVDGVRGEVLARVQCAVGARVVGHRGGERPAVERVTMGVADRLERRREGLAGEGLAGQRCAPSRQEVLGEPQVVRQHRGGARPLRGDRRRHREAVAGMPDRRREQVGEGQRAEPLRQRGPAGDRAGDGHRLPAAGRDLRLSGVARRGHRGRRAARRVEAAELAAVPDDGEEVAADAVADRLDDRQRDRRRDRRVDRIAAPMQHRESRLHGERLRRGDRVAGQHRLPA
jgi:hypothetical protein